MITNLKATRKSTTHLTIIGQKKLKNWQQKKNETLFFLAKMALKAYANYLRPPSTVPIRFNKPTKIRNLCVRNCSSGTLDIDNSRKVHIFFASYFVN